MVTDSFFCEKGVCHLQSTSPKTGIGMEGIDIVGADPEGDLRLLKE
jgi:hypothetical protein